MPWWLFAFLIAACPSVFLAFTRMRRRALERKARRGEWPCPKCHQPFGPVAAKRSWDFGGIGPRPGAIGIQCSECGPMLITQNAQFLLDPREPCGRE
jgi:hypothetical protein